MLRDEVFDWLAQQPAWQQDLARRLVTKVELENDEYAEALRLIKSQFGVETTGEAPEPQSLEREHLSASTTDAPARLRKFGRLRGVGLVADDEELAFAPQGITLIYGQNAAGKSSYVRGLKVLCRTVDRDCQIRGSIYDESTGSSVPSAMVEFQVGDSTTDQRADLDGSSDVSIPGVSVFDSACAELYVGASNTIQYVPTELLLLARLASLQDQLRRDLDRESRSLQEEKPSIASYSSSTVVGHTLAKLIDSPLQVDLGSLAALTTTQQERASELRGVIETAASATTHEDALAAQRDSSEARSLADSISSLTWRLSDDTANQLRAAAEAQERAQEAVRLAADHMAGPVPGIGDHPWLLLWNAARHFVEYGDGTFPPSEGDYCPFCLQPVDTEAATRLSHFDEHVRSTVQATATKAADKLSELTTACHPQYAEACKTPLLISLGIREPDLAAQVNDLITRAADHLQANVANPDEASAATIDVESAVAALTAWADARAAHATALFDSEDPEGLQTLQDELADLEDRQRLQGELHIFESWRDHLQTIAAIGRAHTALATNRITTVQRRLTESEIGKALDAALSQELQRLSCTHLPIQLSTQTAVAETTVRLGLLAHDPAALAEVASEGELRALALCFFLAELSVLSEGGGIILDDPVSSLDDERRRYIADRLTNEAAKRQVIVFTHDLPFVFDLLAQAKKFDVSVKVQHVWRQGDQVGRVDDHPPFKTMNLRRRLGALDQELSRARTSAPPSDYDDVWRAVSGFYSRLRTSWERAVEERLFAGVIERFQRDVQTRSLKYAQLTTDLVDQVTKGMDRASMFMHDAATAAPPRLPDYSEMRQDLEALQSFERNTRL